MKTDIRKIILGSLIILVSLVIVDQSIGRLCDLARSRARGVSGEVQKIIYNMRDCDQDVVILGSSRASHGYVPDTLTYLFDRDSLSVPTIFNGGLDNQGVLCQICMAESILSRYKPQLVIIDVYDDEFRWGREMRTRLERFAPFYSEDEVVKDYLDDLGMTEKIKMLSRMYRYNHKMFGLLAGLRDKGPMTNGYIPLYENYVPTPGDSLKYIAGNTPIDDYTLDRFRTFLKMVQEHHYPVIIVSSPTYYDFGPSQILRNACNEYEVPYYDYSVHPEFRHRPECFKDAIHLNHQGASDYSKVFYETAMCDALRKDL